MRILHYIIARFDLSFAKLWLSFDGKLLIIIILILYNDCRQQKRVKMARNVEIYGVGVYCVCGVVGGEDTICWG